MFLFSAFERTASRALPFPILPPYTPKKGKCEQLKNDKMRQRCQKLCTRVFNKFQTLI